MRGPKQKPIAQKAPIIRDALAVIPVKPDTVEVKHDSAGHAHLRMRMEPKGLAKRVADWLGHDYSRKVELDEYGTLFYDQVDGQTPLKSIIKTMARHRGGSAEDMEQSVVLFTKKLMTMNMLALKVPETIPSRKNS